VTAAWLREIEELDGEGNAVCTGWFDYGADAENERLVERVAGRLAAAGCDEVAWTRDELDAGLADIDAQWERAGRPESFGWTTSHRLEFVLTGSAEAPAYRPVAARVRAAVLEELGTTTGRRPYERGAVDIEDRWGVEVEVHPPGYAFQPPLL